MHTNTHMQACMHAHAHKHEHTHTHTHTHSHTHTHTNTHTCAHTQTTVCMCVCVCMSVSVFVPTSHCICAPICASVRPNMRTSDKAKDRHKEEQIHTGQQTPEICRQHRTHKIGCLLACLTSQQQAQERICSDRFACYHTEIEVTDQTFYLTQSQYTDTGPTSPSADPITPGAWQGSHWSANF